MNDSYTGAAHLLLSLLKEKKGLAAKILAQFNVRYEDTRRILVEEALKEKPKNAVRRRLDKIDIGWRFPMGQFLAKGKDKDFRFEPKGQV